MSAILLVSLPGVLSIGATLGSPAALWAIRRLRRRALRRNRHGRCGACDAALPFSPDPDDLPVAAGIFLCASCARRWRRRAAASFVVMPLLLGGLALSAMTGVMTANMPPGFWGNSRALLIFWPTLGTAIAWGLAVRAIRRANREQRLPAYDSVTEALDEIRARRTLLALPNA
jgi:hypothetical protein